LNGTFRRDPETPADPVRDHIRVDGRNVQASDLLYIVLNKPRGTVTTASDEKGRRTVYSLLPEGVPWVGPVGRLDKASEGLLLMTNDSEWSARVLDPESHMEKEYHVQVASQVTRDQLWRMERGVIDEKGEDLRVKCAGVLRSGERNCWLRVVLEEGKNRQIRRILAVLGLEPLRLVRVRIGPLELGELAKGASRELSAAEKQSLDRAMESQS
jgi:23S rRNA pseudouridine2605 synthase